MSSLPVSGTPVVIGTVNDYAVRVRRGPSTNYGIITELLQGTKGLCRRWREEKNGETWYKISFKIGSKTVTGYMRSDFIKIQ